MKTLKLLVIVTTIAVSSFGHAKEILSPHSLPHPYLFELRKDGKISYVFGTQHLDVFDKFPVSVLKALQNSSIFVSESSKSDQEEDASEADDSKVQPPIALDDTIVSRLHARGLAEKYIEVIRQQPKYGGMLYIYYEAFATGQTFQTMDDRLAEMAQEQHKPLFDLDDKEIDQIADNVVNSIDLENVVHNITPEQAKGIFEKAMNEYRRGKLADAADADDTSDDVAEVKDRNYKWLPKILNLHQQQAFIAVGAGHLGGKNGILHLLQENGFTIKRLR